MSSSIVTKAIHTVQNIGAVARHHYGGGATGLLRMAYISVIRVNTFVMFERILDDSVQSVFLDPEFSVVRPNRDQLDKIRFGKQWPREFYYDHIHGVKNCYLVLCGEEPAYIHWVYTSSDPNRFLRLGPNVAEINYITTLQKFRGKKLMANLVLYTLYDLKKRGFGKVVVVVHSGNPAAIINMQLAKFHEIRRIHTLGFLNLKYDVA